MIKILICMFNIETPVNILLTKWASLKTCSILFQIFNIQIFNFSTCFYFVAHVGGTKSRKNYFFAWMRCSVELWSSRLVQLDQKNMPDSDLSSDLNQANFFDKFAPIGGSRAPRNTPFMQILMFFNFLLQKCAKMLEFWIYDRW